MLFTHALWLILGLGLFSTSSEAAPTVIPSDQRPTVGIGVSPIIIDYTFGNQQKSSTTPVEIESAMTGAYQIDPIATDLVQDADGTLLPADAGAHPSSCASWLTFNQTTMTLPARGKLLFDITVNRPTRTTGTHLCGVRLIAIPAETQTQQPARDQANARPGMTQLTFTYTVVIKVTLPGTTPVPKITFDHVVLVGEPPYPSVEVLVHNTSETGYPLSITAELRQRDAGTNVRVPLLIQRGHDYVSTQTLWPDGSARAIGRVPMPIPPGAYTLTIRAVVQRRIVQHTVDVTVPISDSADLAWQDPIKPLVFKANQRQAATIYLYNLTDTTLTPTITASPTHPTLCQGWTIDPIPAEGPIAPHGYRRLQVNLTAGPQEPSTCVLTVTALAGAIRLHTDLIASTKPTPTPPVVTIQSATYRPDTSDLTVTLQNGSVLPAFYSSWTVFLTSGPRHLPVGHWSQNDPKPVIPNIGRQWTINLPTGLTSGVYTVRMMGFWKERTIILGEQELLVSGDNSLHEPGPVTR